MSETSAPPTPTAASEPVPAVATQNPAARSKAKQRREARGGWTLLGPVR